MSKSRTASTWAALALAVLLASPATADWLVTSQGQLIETYGPWAVDSERLVYVDPDGAEHTLALKDVDLEASEEMTAVAQGREYVAAKNDADAESAPAAAESGEALEIILYQTSWCGYCRKARKLLKDLDADFVAKDIESDKEAAGEYRQKGRGYRGIPLIAYGDQVLRGYSERGIREMARDQKERSSDSSK